MKQKNTPLLVMIAVLALLFIVPFVLALVTLVVYGRFALPGGLFTGLLAELDANFVLALLITTLPLMLVWAVEANRQREGGSRRSLGLTLGLIVLLMVAVTAVPAVAFLRPLGGLPPGDALAILAVVALPLITVVFVVAILLPGLARRKGPPPED